MFCMRNFKVNILKKNSPSLFDFDIVSKIERSNATVSELRVPIFSPIEKVSHNSKVAVAFRKNKGIRAMTTSWGECTTRGRVLLGQQHRDILDCIYLNATKYEHTEHGSMKIYFCQRKVLIAYFGSVSSGKNNHSWLRTKLEEIRDTAIAFKNLKGDSFDFNIIKHLDFESQREMFCIELDERYVKFYAQDMSINYQKLLPNIMGIRNSTIKALVRFILSHSTIRIGLAKTLSTIGYPFDDLTDRNKREFLKELRECKLILLEKFSIVYDDGLKIFEYAKHSDITFISSSSRQKEINGDGFIPNKQISIETLIGRTIERNFFGQGLITASIYNVKCDDKEYIVDLLFPDGRVLTIDVPFPSLLEIEKITLPSLKTL